MKKVINILIRCRYIQSIKSLIIICLLAFSPVAYASSTYNVDDMLLHLQSSLGPLYNLAMDSMYVVGIALALKGVYDLRIYGEARTMMSSSNSVKGPLVTLFVAVMCIYAPSAFQTVMVTTFGYSNVLAYSQFPSSSPLGTSAIIILQVVQVIGAYTFLRGWILLARTSSSQGGHGVFGRAILHILGGVFAMNIVGTCNVISATFGITF